MGVIHKCYCYRTPSGMYVYSLRQGTRISNSIADGKYKTRGGRNKAVQRIIKMYAAKGIRIAVIRNERPPKK